MNKWIIPGFENWLPLPLQEKYQLRVERAIIRFPLHNAFPRDTSEFGELTRVA